MVNKVIQRVLDEGRTELTDLEASVVLSDYGIPVVETHFASSRDEAVRLAKMMGYPLVMKISSPDILHKTEVGGVITGITSVEGIGKAFEDLIRRARAGYPDARIEGVTLQPQVERGVEVIVGGLRDPIFGAAVMFGLGGIWIELFKDVAYRLAPTTHKKALRMISEIRAYPILRHYRMGESVDLDALADVVVAVGDLLTDHPQISEVDVNPIFARSNGCVGVDAKVILGGSI